MKILSAKSAGDSDIMFKYSPEEHADNHQKKDFKGEKDQRLFFYGADTRILLIGLGKEKDFVIEILRAATANALKFTQKLKLNSVSIELPKIEGFNKRDLAEAVIDGLLLGSYAFDKYKEKKDVRIEKAVIITEDNINELIHHQEIICNNVGLVRDLINESTTEVNPETIEKIVKSISLKNRLHLTVYDEKQLRKIGMNLLLAVGQGSRYKPRLMVLEYKGNKRSNKKIALVGKGITFDSGGLNLKPTTFIETMRLDMAGLATALGIIKTASELKLKHNLLAVMPCCENMIGPMSYKPGDVVRSYSGKTIEIGNTDAEGRLILADALAYTVDNYKPSAIIDFATLTGAILYALGEYAAGLFTNSDDIAGKIAKAGEETFERVWKMPLYQEYSEEIKSDIADLNNTTKYKYAGSITAAAFLKEFIRETPWVHIDIAGTAWYEKARGYQPKNATGFGLRLIIKYLENEG